MWPPNTFSLHDLAGALVAAGLAVTFYAVFWKGGRHRLNLLFANFASWGALACLVTFLQDNVVPEGADAAAIPGAPGRTLLLFRLSYGVAVMALPAQLHFVLRYCESRSALAQHVSWAYAVAVALLPLLLLPSVLGQRSVPVAPTSGWTHAVPWMPAIGPTAFAMALLWAGVQVYCQVLLWRLHERADSVRIRKTEVGLIRLALLSGAAGVVIDTLNAAMGFTGVAVLPVAIVVMMTFMAGALLRRHRESRAGGA